MPINRMHRYVRLALSVAMCQSAGIVGSLFTFPSITGWYATLVKPPFTPPDWVFGPVWLLLYALMGVSLWIVWNRKADRKVLYPFAAQLAVNAVWSFLFFGLRNPAAGLTAIISLWLLIACTIRVFHKVDRNAAHLLVPYLAWVTIAAYLNYGIFILN